MMKYKMGAIIHGLGQNRLTSSTKILD